MRKLKNSVFKSKAGRMFSSSNGEHKVDKVEERKNLKRKHDEVEESMLPKSKKTKVVPELKERPEKANLQLSKKCNNKDKSSQRHEKNIETKECIRRTPQAKKIMKRAQCHDKMSESDEENESADGSDAKSDEGQDSSEDCSNGSGSEMDDVNGSGAGESSGDGEESNDKHHGDSEIENGCDDDEEEEGTNSSGSEGNEDESDDDDDDDDESDEEDSSSSSSSSSEDEEEPENEEGLSAVPWGELAADAPMTEEATTRLALCNMDWEHVKAVDIFVLLYSFKPLDGFIKSVMVYPSDFGLERMKIEEEEGPMKLIGAAKNEQEQLNNLRRYEMDKLKYYYAVVTCDSVETADFLYKSCDGMQFLDSGVSIDLRFIPEDMTFDRRPSSVATSMPDSGTYKPPQFENKALHHTTVSLTWDETPADRLNAFCELKKDMDLEEYEGRIKKYLAPPSDSEEEEEEGGEEEGTGNDDKEEEEDPVFKKPKRRPFTETIAIYKNLLKEIDEKEVEEERLKQEKKEIEKKLLADIEGNLWGNWSSSTAKNDDKNDKKKKTDSDNSSDDDSDDDEEEEEEGEDEDDDDSEGELDADKMDVDEASSEDDDEDDEEEEEVKAIPKKGKKKISNKKLVKMKIKEKMMKKQKAGSLLPQTSMTVKSGNDRFKKLAEENDFSVDQEVTDKTTKQKQRRILAEMKKSRR